MAIPREPARLLTSSNLNGLRRDYTPTPELTRAYTRKLSSLSLTKAYLLGALHDATERQS